MIGNARGPGGKFFLLWLFQKRPVFKMDRKVKMNTKTKVQLLQSISFQPSICYSKEKCGPWISVFLQKFPLGDTCTSPQSALPMKGMFFLWLGTVFFSSSVFANETSLEYRDRQMFAKQVYVGGCTFHCPRMKVQEHREPQFINLLFGIKVINSACSLGYWLVLFLSLVQAHSLCENWELKSEWQCPTN